MRLVTLSVIFSLSFHLLIFYKTQIKHKVFIKKELSKPKIKIAFKRVKIKSPKKNKKSSLQLSDLSFKNDKIKGDYYIGKFGDPIQSRSLNDSLRNSLYDHIEKYIYYPKAFERKKIFGIVQARVVLDSSGKFKENLTKVSSNSSYLKVLVFKILNKAFKNYNRKLKSDQSIIFDMAIEFSLSNTYEPDQLLEKRYFLDDFFSFIFQRQNTQRKALNSPRNNRALINLNDLVKPFKGARKDDMEGLRSFQRDPRW